jgi:ABC-2 type transport system ATP-binding protein
MDATLEVRNLCAGYGGWAVVTDVSFVVQSGQWLGLIGANGSGKSTLLRAITGQIELLDGSVHVDGHDLGSARTSALGHCGYAIDAADMPSGLTGRQYLEMVASIRGCRPDDWPEPALDRQLGFARWLDIPLSACSLGTKTKISIAAALLGSPLLLILDESLNGLDPVASWRVRQMLDRLVSVGRHAVILSTHQIDAIGSFCTDAIFLQDGRVEHVWDRHALQAAREQPGGFEAMVMSAVLANATDP